MIELKKKLPISKELEKLYTESAPIGFEIDWTVEWLVLYSPDELYDCQFGYQWIDDIGTEEDETWDKNWIVIGDCSADPIIANVGEKGTPILMAVHGIGDYTPRRIAPSLSSYFDILTMWLDLVYGDFKGKRRNANGTFNTTLNNVLKKNLINTLPIDCIDNFLYFLNI